MRCLIAMCIVGCCIAPWADELPAQGQEIKVLTAEHAKAARAGVFDSPEIVSLLQAADSDYELKGTKEVVVVHADVVERLAFTALSSKYVVIYRNLKRIDDECQEALGKDRIRPSFPSLEEMTPDLAVKLSKCKEPAIQSLHGLRCPLQLCGLKSIDKESLEALHGISLCLCGLTQLTSEQASGLMYPRHIHTTGVLLSRKTQLEEDAKERLRPHVFGKEHNHRGPLVRSFDPGQAFWIHDGIRLINDRCQHRLITLATPAEHQARQPPPKPKRLPPQPDPFEPD